MSSRHYSSFLLRFWFVSDTSSTLSNTDAPGSVILQIQNLQTGVTWRLNNLTELNDLLGAALVEAQSKNGLSVGLSGTEEPG